MSVQPIKSPRRVRASDWCIIRMSGARTLAVADSLADAGLEVWTPRRIDRRRLPRGKKGHKEVEVALMPTFAFARATHLRELQAIRADPKTPHPAFSIFKHLNSFPAIGDREINTLRSAEQKARSKKDRHTFAPGTRVQVPEGAFTGLSGQVVDGGRGKFTLVCFGGSFEVQIATFLLRTDEVQDAAHSGSATGLAA